MEFKNFEVILYVQNQTESAAFYSRLFQKEPDLDVPGMTEFILADNLKLGLMPNLGIARILENKMPHPDTGTGIPRCELYLMVKDVESAFAQSVSCGAKVISEVCLRNWGHKVGYLADLDGHILAFAQEG